MRALYVWQGSYQAAILETNDKKLPNCLQAAKAAIDNRLHDLQDYGGTPEERQAITPDGSGRLTRKRRGYVLKSDAAHELATAIRQVHKKERYVGLRFAQ